MPILHYSRLEYSTLANPTLAFPTILHTGRSSSIKPIISKSLSLLSSGHVHFSQNCSARGDCFSGHAAWVFCWSSSRSCCSYSCHCFLVELLFYSLRLSLRSRLRDSRSRGLKEKTGSSPAHGDTVSTQHCHCLMLCMMEKVL